MATKTNENDQSFLISAVSEMREAARIYFEKSGINYDVAINLAGGDRKLISNAIRALCKEYVQNNQGQKG